MSPPIGEAQAPTEEPPPSPPAPIVPHVSPRELWEAYSDNEVAGDLKYRGKDLVVTGIVRDISKDVADNILVALDVGEILHAVMCHVPKNEITTVAKLSKGQLVALRGTGRGFVMQRPVLGGCHVIWAGPKAKDKIDPKVALATARSLNICAHKMVRVLMPELATARDGGPVSDDDLMKVLEAQPAYRSTVDKANADLSAAGLVPLPCDHPSLFAASRCESESVAKRPPPECKTPWTKAVMAAIQTQ
ncbi:hypothetical protein QEG98_28185 [Myxococcus sp. MxC21-1]|uniref:OB-fold protein n=1 Tax=Myxococcus sp. MxC21-1 TaxID=3041439 RepID=UPI00292EA39C|nr:hypothetical protein [Myxococcus sp. MxC21-1]WNZ59885.1 hypothetical protein QEG98_28185 [Myxococcus sp. MxC21-1]